MVSVHCLPTHPTDWWVRGGSYLLRHRSDEKNSFCMNQMENWKCYTLTTFHAWHNPEAILSDNIINGGLRVLFCHLYYEDVVAAYKWTIPRITCWKGSVIFFRRKQNGLPTVCCRNFLCPRCQLPFQRAQLVYEIDVLRDRGPNRQTV